MAQTKGEFVTGEREQGLKGKEIVARAETVTDDAKICDSKSRRSII